jgi:microcystin-dependent protein
MKKTVIALYILFPGLSFACTPGDNAFIGSVCMMLTDYCPVGTLPMDGRRLKVSENDSLYAVVGDTYGKSGDDFALPDLRGKEAVGVNSFANSSGRSKIDLGGLRGNESISLSAKNLPAIDVKVGVKNSKGTDLPSTDYPMLGKLDAAEDFMYVQKIESSKQTEIKGMHINRANANQQNVKTLPPQTAITWCIVTDGFSPW